MHIGNATSPAEIRSLIMAVLIAVLLGVRPAERAYAASQHTGFSPRPTAQQQQGVTRQLYLLPADNSAIQLQTHLAGINVTYHEDGSVSAIVNADYYLKNETADSVTLPLVVYPGIGSALPQAVTLTAYGQALPLIATDGGSMTSQVEIPADNQATLRLSYRVTVADAPIVSVRYAPSVLRKWRGPTSTRIEVTLPDAIARESWTKVTPDSWTYATSDVGFTAIKWLYDSLVPEEEFIVQFVEPILWSQVQAAEASSASGGPVAAYLARGDLYRRLAGMDAVDPSVRDRFASQAVAAYTEGIGRPDASTADLASMHSGLATLYRNRAAQSDVDSASYAALLADEAAAALANLDAEDVRRVELQQWLSDGLRTLFADARARGDWQNVSRVVERMEALPPEVVDQALIEEGRKIVLVEQALQLIRRGEHETAAKLIGAELPPEAVQAPAELRPLYAAWHLTVTALPEKVSVGIEAIPAKGREAEARMSFDNLAQAWRSEIERTSSEGALLISDTTLDEESGALTVRVDAPAPSVREALVNYVPSGGDYVFLRRALAQLSPNMREDTRFFQREVELSQPMDLHEAGDKWTAIAADIDRQAKERVDQASAGSANEQLIAEMQAANYRSAANEWRNLVRDSWLRFQFDAGDESSQTARAWYATTMSAPVVFNEQTQYVELSRMLGMAFALIAGIIFVSGVLWWLL
ncbi:MAG: hypothetical protein ACK2UO_20735 [Caldilineaceae bacterium]